MPMGYLATARSVSDVPRETCQRSLDTPQEPLAARLQREHQRTSASVLPEGNRSLGSLTGRAQSRRSSAQRATSRDAQLDDTIGENDRGRCNDPLTPPSISRHRVPGLMSRAILEEGSY